MPFSSRSYVNRYVPSNRFPVGLKWLLIVNVSIFVLYEILKPTQMSGFFQNFELVPEQVVRTLALWQLVTYMFLHTGISHILWNMLGLWMFGTELERLWGTRKFLRFYFICGIAAAVSVVVAAYLFGGKEIPTAGSSGAVYGILMAYGLTFPDRTILFGFLIPIKSKYFVMIIGGIVLLQSYLATAGGQGSGVAVLAHLGGLLAGYLYLRGRRLQGQIRQPVVSSYKDWKLRRAKRKFEVYLRKEDSKRGPWVH
ncbi:MAG: rhomboid family intramembrane serine protease [Acidobacteriaceae bacterium]|nr:rhomboid family intramembrane serine protease [Acidobacteriaceae bacterium]MBV9307196.1 rhomboid family intramembrane serine protease [Acidobacteriaceae bacterium]